MRELKFRAWDGRRMSNTVSINNLAEKQYSISFESVVFMQYTGLKDKNGTEVYEGDIVSFVVDDEDADIGVIQWSQNIASLGFNCNGDDAELLFYDDAKYFEVIGNIYENPDLINKNTRQ